MAGRATNYTIRNSYATGSVTGGASAAVGGLVGDESYGEEIINCFATGTITGGNSAKVGGLTGYNSYPFITNTYATCSVTGGKYSNVGGLVGCNSTTDTCSVANGYLNSNATQTIDGTVRALSSEVGVGSGTDATTSKSSSDMQASTFLTLLNTYASTDDILTSRKFISGSNSGYPMLNEVGNTTAAEYTLQSIAITTPATKLNYSVGDNLDISGLVVIGTYSDGSKKTESITTANITGFNSDNTVVDQVLTITVGAKTTTYKVQIVATPDTSGMIEMTTTSPTVGPSKVWIIKLNGIVNEDSIKNNIYITNSNVIIQIPICTVTTANGLSQISVTSETSYTPDDYILWVRDIKSATGTRIKSQVYLKFTVQPINPQVTVSSVAPVSVATNAGTAPVLPTTVTATMSDGTTKTVNVSWDAIVATKYAVEGTFTVNGTVSESTVPAICTVIVGSDKTSNTNFISIKLVTPLPKLYKSI